jgi:hypothetical protein
MTAADLVARLHARGVELRADGATLVVRPRSAVSPAELQALRAHKAAIMDLLRTAARPRWDSAVALGRVRTTLRAVARAYPPQSRLARTPAAAAALERLDRALLTAIEAEDLPAVERALAAWETWWAEHLATWRATAAKGDAAGGGQASGARPTVMRV